MLARIMRYYFEAKWIHWGFNIITMILGTYLIIGSYTFFQGIQGHPSGNLVLISGVLFLCNGGLCLLSQSTTARIIGALFAIFALGLFIIA